MHSGSITNPKSKAGRLYRIMRANPGKWFDSWQLTMLAGTTAIATRISEIRQQLPSVRPGEMVEHDQRGRLHYYRITLDGGQLEHAVVVRSAPVVPVLPAASVAVESVERYDDPRQLGFAFAGAF